MTQALTAVAGGLRALTAAATPGPWEAGDVWSWAGCGFMGLGADECTLCARMGDPVWTGKADINGKRMHAHKHRNPHPYAIDHRTSGPSGLVAGNYDYEEGGIIDPTDLELIMWLRNHADALADLIGALDGYRTAHHTGHAEARLDARVVMFRARSALDQEAPT